MLHGGQVVPGFVVRTDVPPLKALLRQLEVRRWRMRDTWNRVDEEGSTVFTILVDGQVASCTE